MNCKRISVQTRDSTYVKSPGYGHYFPIETIVDLRSAYQFTSKDEAQDWIDAYGKPEYKIIEW